MTELSTKILESYQIRKTGKQKTAFLQFLQTQIPDLQVETGGFPKNRNLIIGDVRTAKVIFSAHYDTCAELPFPNLIFPKNILLSVLYSILLVLPFLALMLLTEWLLLHLTDNFLLSYYVSLLFMLAAVFFVFFVGRPNRHTANDNTSGVITLCELMHSLNEDTRRQVAFVFFDNEEFGLLGSAFFRKLHKKDGLNQKLLINLDCVSDGDHILLVQNPAAEKRYGAALREAFSLPSDKTVHFERSTTTFYPSDQSGFPVSIAVAALKKGPLGLFMNRIHTRRDVVFDRENLSLLCRGFSRFLTQIFSQNNP